MTREKRSVLLSSYFMGLGQFYNGAILRGVVFFLIEILFIFNFGYIIQIVQGSISADASFAGILEYTNLPDVFRTLKGLITLGHKAQQVNGFDVIQGDHSIFKLVDGLILILSILLVSIVYRLNIASARKCGKEKERGVKKGIFEIINDNFFNFSLTPGFIAILFFTFLPMIITVCVAFTNYSAPDHIPPRSLVDWVGFKNFKDLFSSSIWGGTMLTVGTWNIIWAVSVSFLNFAGGMILALLLSRKEILNKGIWRIIFVLPYAIPAFINMLIMRILFNGVGPINNVLTSIGLDGIPFLSNGISAKIVVICVAVWIGAPYFMILISSAMTNISSNIYEAAQIDGASRVDQFKKITLPLVLTQLTPALILTFSMNFNNFGAIYLLTDGKPTNSTLRYAGDTDIFISWIYKLTYDNQQFAMAASVTILLFIFIAGICAFYFTPAFIKSNFRRFGAKLYQTYLILNGDH